MRVIEAIYSKLTFFVRDSWGISSTRVQEEGLRQGDPLACFLLVILMTVTMIDARERYVAECQEKNTSSAQRESDKIFGFDDVEYADDTNFFK